MNSDLISIVALIISGIALFLEIRREQSLFGGKLEVIIALESPQEGEFQHDEHLVFRITNIGKTQRIILRPFVEVNKGVDGKKCEMSFETHREFPTQFERGQFEEVWIEAQFIYNRLERIDRSRVKNFRGVVVDTFGKKYYSKPLPIGALMNTD